MLQIRNLSKTFNKNTVNENVLFSRLCLNVNKGDFVTVIGSNGAGKSTLLNLISGTEEIDKGEIILDGLTMSRMPEYRRTPFIGRVFQNPALGTSPSMTILENLSMACSKGERLNLSMGVSKKKLPFYTDILTGLSLGLENKLHTKVGLLSGGQRQALSILMASLSTPRLLLLDEHTAALDPKASVTVMELTQKIIAEKNMTTMMITHNINHAIKYGTRIIMLHQGKIMLDLEGVQKKQLSKEAVLKLFENVSGDSISDRSLLS